MKDEDFYKMISGMMEAREKRKDAGDKSFDNRAQRLQVSGLCADLPKLFTATHRNPCSETVPCRVERKKEKQNGMG